MTSHCFSILTGVLTFFTIAAMIGSKVRAFLVLLTGRVAPGIAMDPQQQEDAAHHRSPPMQTFSIFTVFIPLIIIVSMVFLIPSPPSSFKDGVSPLHQVPEGHVGVYWRGGALLQTITEPGFHLKMPFITQYQTVQITLKTDTVTDIPCVTKGGFMIKFEKIEVMYRLRREYVHETLLKYGLHYNKTWIYDKIHHHINQFCASHNIQQVYMDDFAKIGEKMKEALQVDCTRYAPGIEIIFVHVTKPTIPDSIHCKFKQMEVECIEVSIPFTIQKVAKKVAETLKKIAISEIAERYLTKLIEAIDKSAEKLLLKYVETLVEYVETLVKYVGEIGKRQLVKYIKAVVEIAKRSSGINNLLSRLFQYLQLLVARLIFHPARNMIR